MGVQRLKQVAGTTSVSDAAAPTKGVAVPTMLPEHFEDPKIASRNVNAIATTIQKQVTEAFTSPMLGGNIIHDVALTNGQSTAIKHGLGRAWRGYLCIRAQTAAFAAYDVANATGQLSSDVLTLHSTATGTYDIWVL